MLFQLIFATLPAMAHLVSVGKASNMLNSPQTYVNLGQFQMDLDNKMGPMRSRFIPITEACEMGECPERMVMTTIPMIKTRKFKKCAKERMMMTDASTMPSEPVNYGNIDASMIPMWMGGRYVMPQRIASPSLNFRVGKIGNVGQKGTFY